jgi:hypothetical protein
MFGGMMLETDEELRARLYYVCCITGKLESEGAFARASREIARASDEELDTLAWRLNLRRRQRTLI